MIKFNDDGVGLGLLLVAMVFLVFGSTLILSSYRASYARRVRYPRWHHKRIIPHGFDFWLGISLIMCVTVVDGIIGLALLRNAGEIALGWLVYFVVAAFATIVAAKHWARDKLPEDM